MFPHEKRRDQKEKSFSRGACLHFVCPKRNLYRFLCISFLLDHTVLNLSFTLVSVYSIMSLSCDHMIYPFRESMQGLWDGGSLWRSRTHAHGLFLYIHSILLRFPHVQSRFPLHLLKTSLSFLHSKKPLSQSKTHSKHYLITRATQCM